MISHLLFSFKVLHTSEGIAASTCSVRDGALNVLAWLVFSMAGAKTKIIDVVDIGRMCCRFSECQDSTVAILQSGKVLQISGRQG